MTLDELNQLSGTVWKFEAFHFSFSHHIGLVGTLKGGAEKDPNNRTHEKNAVWMVNWMVNWR
jgi:hypothetical protein